MSLKMAGVMVYAVLLLFTALPIVQAYRILMMLPFGSYSHRNVFQPLSEELSRRGHEVTIVGMLERTPESANIRELVIPEIAEEHKKFSESLISGSKGGFMSFCRSWVQFIVRTTDVFLDSNVTKSLLESSGNAVPYYDLVLVSGLSNEFAFAVASRVGRSVGLLLPPDLLPWVANQMYIPDPFSYIPNQVTDLPVKMDFLQRLRNFYSKLLYVLIFNYYLFPLIDSRVKLRYPDLPSVNDVYREVAMVMVNIDPVMTVARPHTPLLFDVGGMHCRDTKNLSGNLLDFVESSGKDGFILFSLGTVVKGSGLPREVIRTFLNVFSRLPQNVVWKYESVLEDIPRNVRIFPWLPQQDILGHPKIRLFITHSGLLSLQETIYHGVPVIGIPVFADQTGNIARVEEMGFGKKLSLNDITEELLWETIGTVMNGTSYKKSIQKYSRIMRDQKESPLERAVFWTEYIIRHNGAKHLRCPGRHLNFIQYFCLDVLAFTAVVLWLSWKVLKCTLFFFMGKIVPTKTKKD